MKSRPGPPCSISRFAPTWLVRSLGAVLALGMLVATAQARKKNPKKEAPPADLPGRVNYLVRQLYGVPLDESAPVTGEIQNLVVAHLDQWMQNRTPTDVEVRQELEQVFSKLHYPFMGRPAVFEAQWKGNKLIGAGYTVGWSDIDRANLVALYESHSGHSRQVALTPFVPRTDLHYDALPPDPSGNFRFIIWGTQLGKSHPRLTAILYSFDGENLKSWWERQDAYDGKIEVDGNQVVIRYLNEDEYIRVVGQNHLPPRHEATYRLTPKGLELESIRDIPF